MSFARRRFAWLAAFALGALAAAHAHAQTVLWFQSTQPQYLVADTAQHRYQAPTDPLFAYGTNGTFSMSIGGTVSVNLAAPGGQRLAVGAYEEAHRLASLAAPSIDFTYGSAGCNTTAGRFAVLDIAFDGAGNILRFAADFELECEEVFPPVYGEIRFNSSLPLTVDKPAGSTTPDPFVLRPQGPLPPSTVALSNQVTAYGINAPAAISVTNGIYSINGNPFTSAPGTVVNGDAVWVAALSPASPGATASAVLTIGSRSASFDVTTYAPGQALTAVHFDSAPNDFILQGAMIDGATPQWLMNGSVNSDGGLTMRLLTGGHSINATFAPPQGSVLTPGAYENAARWPFGAGFPGLEVDADSHGCNHIDGRFVILEVAYSGSTVTKLAADFEQSCDGGGPLFGEIRFNSTVPLTSLEPANTSTPDAFALGAPNPVLAGSTVMSNTISVLGVNAPVPVSISGGLYSVNGAPYTSAPGTVQLHDHVTVQLTASRMPGASTGATLTLGNRSVSMGATSYKIPMTVSGIYVRSPGGDFAGGGLTQLLLAPQNLLTAQRNYDNGVSLTLWGRNALSAFVDFASGTSTLVPGKYANAGRFPFASANAVSFTLSGGCNMLTGDFTVIEAAYNGDGSVARFAANLHQSCDGGPLAYVEVRYNSTVPFSVLIPHSPAIDLDGDGLAEALLVHTDGSTRATYLTGINAGISQTLFGAGTGMRVLKAGDFDGDGRTDFLVAKADGSVDVWLMNGTNSSITNLMGAGNTWLPTQVADLDHDGKADIVWTNSDGAVDIMLMNGATATQRTRVMPPGSGWSVAFTGDFNGDGNADLLWHNADGTTSIWLMNGATILERGPVMAAGTAWTPVAVADFDGDGRSDIVWNSSVDNTTSVWLMNGRAIADRGAVMAGGTAWSVAQVADVNADGRADILWRHADGRVGLWLMNGRTLVDRRTILDPGSGWTLTSASDIDADARADLFWTSTDGSLRTWLMDGLDHSVQSLILGAATGWRLWH
ncbi:MAG TPA: VCBS repeat-containing protein [Usitatibacter sp.]|jgi:hypothetical protein|nr:VCBS repeat-containing protein [Usitatibacter sp.]